MKTEFTLTVYFNASAKDIYTAWLDSDGHTSMTGAEADCSSEQGGKFTAWDGYISGENVRLIPCSKIIQKWRTSEFKLEEADSELFLSFKDTSNGCKVTVTHKSIPAGQPDYKQGWLDFYFTPMKQLWPD
jgi:activator of HSP90 ATPase